MSNKDELETVHEKIKGLDNELDTFIKTVREIKEIRDMVGTLPEDLKQNNAAIEKRKKDIESLISSIEERLTVFEDRAKEIIVDLENKSAAMTAEVKFNISEIKNTATNGGNYKALENRIKKVEERFFNTLTRQKYAITIISVILLAGIAFYIYVFFVNGK